MGSGKKHMIILAIVLWACLVVASDYAWTADYPTRPINFMIPYGAGGATDLACRALLDGASKILGQPFVPINKGGAGGTLAAMSVMTAKPDGYTIGANSISNSTVAVFAEDNPYKDLSGFTQIMNFGNYITTVMVRNDAPWKTWKEFIEWARKNPGAAKIGLTGSRRNSFRALMLQVVERKENVKFTFIPLKGTADLMTTLLGGHTNLSGSAADPTTVPYLKTGKIRILLFISAPKTKMPGAEDVPTLEELYGVHVPNIMGVWGPKGMPEPILNKLEDAFTKAISDPGFINLMNKMYFPIAYKNRTEMAEYIKSTTQQMGDVIQLQREEDARAAKAAVVKN